MCRPYHLRDAAGPLLALALSAAAVTAAAQMPPPGAKQATPTCSLSASPTQVTPGTAVRLSAQCQPAAASYQWVGADLPANASGGTVTPNATTTYSVRGVNTVGTGNLASATVRVSSAATDSGYSPATNYANDFCTSGNYPTQWEWNPALTLKQPAPATSGTPRMVQIRDGKVIATYGKLGGNAYSKPNSSNGEDPSIGPFRRSPYTQWKSGDVFEIYPAVYSGADMQIYIGPNLAYDGVGTHDIPRNITIRGITVDGKRPVIVNPPSGSSNNTMGQGLIYIDGEYKDKKLATPSADITIENIDIVDSPDGGTPGKAAVYVNGVNNLTLRNVRIAGFKLHQANGIFATPNNSGTLLLDNVELDGNGGSGGPEHNAYINMSSVDPNFTFQVRNSWSHGSYYGHALKSRAQRTIVEGSYLAGTRAAAGQQTDTYLLDVPDGGTLIARNNVFVKNFSGNNSNGASITFGVESTNQPRTWELVIEHNTFVGFSRYYDDQKHVLFPLFIGSAAPGPRTVDANVFVGYCTTGNASRDFRGTNASVLNFNEIDQSFRPRNPQLSGRSGIVGTPQYSHQLLRSTRRTTALGARD
jgi:hypothetical protein